MARQAREYWENRPEIYEMLFSEFAREYAELSPIMQDKEGKIGKLDLHASNYVPMTEEEIVLHAKDWKAFSRSRGFGEYDIAEYGRWHKITGQTDGLEYAVNDPWRRPTPEWDVYLYLKHIELAKGKGMKLSPKIEHSYTSAKKEYEEFLNNPKAPGGISERLRENERESANGVFQSAIKNIMAKQNKISATPISVQNERDDW
jgi:hypothetical protein